MTENPYDILGVPHNASIDEVKKAYRKKARENHPDLNPNDPDAADRMNKINEAYDRITNPEKYAKEDARKRAAAGGAPYASGYGSAGSGNPYTGTNTGYRSPYGNAGPNSQNPYDWVEINWEDIFGGSNAGGNPYGWTGPTGAIHPEASANDTAEVRQAISYINAANYRAALGILNNITSAGRNARWYYLSALANNGAGNTVSALENIRRARQMDPGNPDYQRAERSFTQRAQTYEQESTERGFSTSFIDPSTLCCCLLCGPSLCQPFLFCL